MIVFWRINLCVSIVVFILFLMSFLDMTDDLVLISIGQACWYFFLYGPYLEVIQIPICILALFIKPRPRRWYLYLLLMFILLIIKKLIVFVVLLMAMKTKDG